MEPHHDYRHVDVAQWSRRGRLLRHGVNIRPGRHQRRRQLHRRWERPGCPLSQSASSRPFSSEQALTPHSVHQPRTRASARCHRRLLDSLPLDRHRAGVFLPNIHWPVHKYVRSFQRRRLRSCSLAVVLGPIASVVLFDYWVVKGQKLNVPQLYQPHGIYAYNKYGTNWRCAPSGFTQT